MVDFDKLARARSEPRYDYLYRCGGCGKTSWRWFELPLALMGVCVVYPQMIGRARCHGPLQLVAMRRKEKG